jgi:hypothetical protein
MCGLKSPVPTVLLLGVLAAVALAADSSAWKRWALVPDCGLEDIYKTLHQAWRGPGHMIASREAAAEYLRQEWSSLGPDTLGEAIVDTLAPGSPFVRLNLRPFRAAGGSEAALLDAFIRSAAAPTDSASMVRDWLEVGRECHRGELPYSPASYDTLDSLVRTRGYPAIHHSAGYEARYSPAYRVLTLDEARRLIAGLPSGQAR